MKKLKNQIVVVLSLSITSLFAAQLEYPKGGINLGIMSQGEVKSFEFEVKNNSNQPYVFDLIIPQGTGVKDAELPKTIGPKSKATFKFDFNSKYLSGELKEFISIIDKNGESTAIPVSGNVQAPFQFSQPVLDFGFFGKKEVTRKIFVWQSNYSVMTKTSPFKFGLVKATNLKAKFKLVFIDASNLDNIHVVNKSNKNAQFAYEVELTLMPQEIKKSLSQIVSFQSESFPLSTPEIHIVGYKK